MMYLYITVLLCFLLLFFLSAKGYQPEELQGKAGYPGEKLFLRSAVYLLRKKEALEGRLGKFRNKASNVKIDRAGQRMGEKLKLLYPTEISDRQVMLFRIRQYSLVLLVLFLGNLFALMIAISSMTGGQLEEGSYILRRDYGQGNKEVSLRAIFPSAETESINEATDVKGGEDKNVSDNTQELTYTIAERKYTDEEIEMLYKETVSRLPDMILGENESLQNVTGNLILPTALEGYPFRISWESDDYFLIQPDGTVCNEELTEEQIVTLTATFRYDERKWEEMLPVQILPYQMTSKERIIQNIMEAVEAQDLASRTAETLILPDHIGKERVIWQEAISDSSSTFFFLLCIAALLIAWQKNREVDQKLEKRRKELLLDYPEIVNKLVLYMGAGMTIRNAFLKMAEDYKKQKLTGRHRYIYEEILLLENELQSGVMETEAYAHLGKRCQLQVYRKFCTLLSQNLRKGSNDLLSMLKQEALSAFEERKSMAKKIGEEAGTKLLVPMMMMLCIVMVIIMVPAYFSFAA